MPGFSQKGRLRFATLVPYIIHYMKASTLKPLFYAGMKSCAALRNQLIFQGLASHEDDRLLEITFVKLQVEKITFLQVHIKELEMTFVKLQVEKITIKNVEFFFTNSHEGVGDDIRKAPGRYWLHLVAHNF